MSDNGYTANWPEEKTIDISKIRTAIGLLNCMVRCGESHSELSEAVVQAALEELKKMEEV